MSTYRLIYPVLVRVDVVGLVVRGFETERVFPLAGSVLDLRDRPIAHGSLQPIREFFMDRVDKILPRNVKKAVERFYQRSLQVRL